MNVIMTLYVAILFFVLTPGIVLCLPPKGSKVTVAITHAIVFALIFQLTHKAVYRMSLTMERFTAEPPKAADNASCPGGKAKVNGVCPK